MIEIDAAGERKIRFVAAPGSAPARACDERRLAHFGAKAGVILTVAL